MIRRPRPFVRRPSARRLAATLSLTLVGPLAFCARSGQESPVAERRDAGRPLAVPTAPAQASPAPSAEAPVEPVPPPQVVEAPPPALEEREAPPARASKASRPKSRVTEPVEISRVDPQYPDICKRHRIEGVVTLRAKISKKGEVDGVEVVNGVHPLLDGAATRAVKLWKYRPATVDGRAVPATMKVKVGFRL